MVDGLRKFCNAAISLVMMVMLLATSAEAVLKDVGPVNPANGFPVWYRDASSTRPGYPLGLPLEQCLSRVISPLPTGGYMCNLLPGDGFDPNFPVVFTSNFPDELFWWAADAIIAQNPSGIAGGLTLGLEGAFAGGGVAAGDQVSFARIRIRIDVPAAKGGTYRVIHPFGVNVFNNVAPGTKAINFTEDLGLGAPGEFKGALNGKLGPFLVWTADAPLVAAGTQNPDGTLTVLNPETATNEVYIGDPNVAHTVAGSPFGTNYFRIERLDGAGNVIEAVQQDLFSLTGKIYTAPIPTRLHVDRATYVRDAVLTQIDIFASTDPLSNSGTPSRLEITGAGLAPITMGTDGAGKFFSHVEYPPATLLPGNIVVTNRVDNGAVPVDALLVDEVTVTLADYDPIAKTLRVKAISSDRIAPPVLQLSGYGPLTNGELTVPDVAVPPVTVTVVSSVGGSETARVTVLHNDATNVPPAAGNDSFTVTAGISAVLGLTNNDSDPNGNLAPATVTVVTPPGIGSVSANANGTVNFVSGTTGTTTFTYTVADTFGAVSAPATVTVTVNPLNVSPAALADIATTAEDTPIDIDVALNDTDPDANLDPASVTVVTQPASGTATTRAVGGSTLITYTPNANFFGTDTFTYRVQDLLGAASTAVATVTVTGVNDPPTGVADVSSAASGVPKPIRVLDNDIDVDGTIAINTIAVTTPTVGTATANADGTLTYASPAGFVGSAAFTYTVQDNLGSVSASTPVVVNVVAANETITVLRARYEAAKGRWRIDGSTDVFGPGTNNTMTIFLGSTTVGAPVIGTAPVLPDGTWSLDVTSGVVPDATRTVSALSAGGAQRPAVPVQVR